MAYLVDTNVLLRSVDLSHPMNPDAINAIRRLRDRGEQFHIVPQNLIEFWNVYTRPTERNGLGRSVAETQSEVNRLKVFFPLLLDTEAIYQE
ncbi:type II toxin-antitoxin system VapC family toxin [Nostoc sp.]|uniref:type II toxin-antitoxin system VapC family toxin n=1 Tax=Nostoc sp. TaxID=1180 RepID=UPI002FF585DA